jgi:hypothetical protein
LVSYGYDKQARLNFPVDHVERETPQDHAACLRRIRTAVLREGRNPLHGALDIFDELGAKAGRGGLVILSGSEKLFPSRRKKCRLAHLRFGDPRLGFAEHVRGGYRGDAASLVIGDPARYLGLPGCGNLLLVVGSVQALKQEPGKAGAISGLEAKRFILEAIYGIGHWALQREVSRNIPPSELVWNCG